MSQADIFGRGERWRDRLVFGAVAQQARRRLPRLRPLAARLADLMPFEGISDPTRNRGAWLGLADIWPGDRAQGQTFLDAWGPDPRALYEPSADATDHGHGFDWLRDLASVDTAAARSLAHAATAHWLAQYGRWQALAWRSDLLARRLANWSAHFVFIASGAPDAAAGQAMQDRLVASARRQLRYLCRAGAEDVDGQARIGAVCHGIVAAIALMPGQAIGEQVATRPLLRLMTRLSAALDSQLQPDGGHVSRSPARQFAVVCDLAAARHALATSLLGVPEWLQRALDRAAPVLRMLRHGDGGLALFQGAQEGRAEAVALALERSLAVGASPVLARHVGYARVAAGNALLIMDCAAAPPPAGHAAPLAIELSVGRQRVFVNCGAMVDGGTAWRTAMRATAAHSTLTLADTNADPGADAGAEAGDRRQPAVNEMEGAFLVEATHLGYAARFGLAHKRAIYCDPEGQDWRGEDTLLPIGNAVPDRQMFAIRFHLHPRVRATLAQDQATVLIRLPDKSGWRFRARGGQVRLASSIYIPDGEAVQRCEQIVVSGTSDQGGAQVQWALQRVA
ncbi:MAG: heparinase II/III family protein [Alphaproteobacteria bacterium]